MGGRLPFRRRLEVEGRQLFGLCVPTRRSAAVQRAGKLESCGGDERDDRATGEDGTADMDQHFLDGGIEHSGRCYRRGWLLPLAQECAAGEDERFGLTELGRSRG